MAVIKTFLRYLVWYNPQVNGPGRVIVAYLLNVQTYRRRGNRAFPKTDRHIGRWIHWRAAQGVWFYLPRLWTVHISLLDVRAWRDGAWWIRRRGADDWWADDDYPLPLKRGRHGY